MRKIVTLWDKVESWLLAPVGAARDVQRRLIFRALRSRFFAVVAAVTAMPVFGEAVGATVGAIRRKNDVTPWLLWAVAAATWVLFILTVLVSWWRFKRRSERAERVRNSKKKTG